LSWYGAIEAGGTKFLCGIADAHGQWLDRTRFDTTTPRETLARVRDFFAPHLSHAQPLALGLASFGPLDLDVGSPQFGHITTTPKPHWRNTDLLTPLRTWCAAPMGFDTDVNAAALAESRWGAGRDCDPVIYVTVGTGVGGGVIVHGRPLHGLMHPEMGHMRVPRLAGDDFPGHCPFHGDCIEGLCSGPALAARCGQDAAALPEDHPEWDRLARYLAHFAANLILSLAPRKLIFGGGVLSHEPLLPLIRRHVRQILNDYLSHPLMHDDCKDLLVAPALGEDAGLSGALALAMDAARS